MDTIRKYHFQIQYAKCYSKLAYAYTSNISARYLPLSRKAFVYFCCIVLCLSISRSTYSATLYSRASAAFSVASTWSTSSGGGAYAGPLAAGDIFIIESPNNVTLTANQSAASITIQSGATLTMSGGNFTLTVPNFTINSGGTLGLNTRVLTLSGNWTNNGSITGTSGRIQASTGTCINNGTINLSTGRVAMTGAGPFTNAGSIVLTTGQINTTTGTFTNSGSITMGAGTILQTTGTFTNSATGTIDITGAATLTFATGDFVNSNTSASVDFGSSAVTISGTNAAQDIGGFVTTGRFTCSKTSGTLTVNGDIGCNGLTKSGAGILDLGAGNTIDCSNTVVLTAGTLNGGSSTLNVNFVSTTVWQGTGTVFSAGSSTVNFNAAGNQTLSATGTKTFYNLTFSGSGTKTNATTTVTNIFSLEGTAVPSATPTYGAAATLRYNTATGRTAGAEWLNTFTATGGVVIDNTGAITANANKVFNANSPLTINSGATLTTENFDFTFNDDFINNGTWTASTGDITLAGTATQSIGAFTTTGSFLLSKGSGTATMTGNVSAGSLTLNGTSGILNLGTGLTHTISGDYTGTLGTLEGNTSTLNLDGSIAITGAAFTANTGTVNLTGAGSQNIPSYTFYKLGFSGAGTKTLTGTTTVNNILTINSPSVFDLGSFTLNLAGSGTPLVNSGGTFMASTSTVNYTNAGSTVITAVNYHNLNGTGGNRIFSTADIIGISGTFTPGAGTYDVFNSEVDFNGAADQSIPTFTFHKLKVSTAGIKKILASTIVACQTIDIIDNASVEINADGGGRLDVLQ
jgi:hypothetical protein